MSIKRGSRGEGNANRIGGAMLLSRLTDMAYQGKGLTNAKEKRKIKRRGNAAQEEGT